MRCSQNQSQSFRHSLDMDLATNDISAAMWMSRKKLLKEEKRRRKKEETEKKTSIYKSLNTGGYLENVQVSLAGRLMNKMSSSKWLKYYDLHGVSGKVHVMAAIE
ncbi:hypothetical protein Tco_0155699 [Tanacetum coccineum]